MSLFPGLSADELLVYGTSNVTDIDYYYNELTNSNTGGSDFWNNIYPIIYTINSAIEGITGSNSLTPAVKKQLLGEAYFMRAFCYFYLVNLYGSVPLATGTDYTVNSVLARTPAAAVWKQINNDLTTAQGLLSSNYVDASLLNETSNRVRPTYWAATALLARSYLYQQMWDSAKVQSTVVLNNSAIYTLDSLNGVFLANSTESIWQIQPVNAYQNTADGALFILPSTGPDGFTYTVYLDTVLVNSFEAGDLRRLSWVDSATAGGVTYYYPYKYKVPPGTSTVTENEMVLRLAEQYLIRAEAEAQLNDLTDAANDLNTIRIRAGLDSTTASTQAQMLAAVYHERQVELFTEWGHRWLDLKRTNNQVTNLLSSEKGITVSSKDLLYPIPLWDIQHDPNLVQNSGY